MIYKLGGFFYICADMGVDISYCVFIWLNVYVWTSLFLYSQCPKPSYGDVGRHFSIFFRHLKPMRGKKKSLWGLREVKLNIISN